LARKVIVGIDGGTQSTKVVLYDLGGSVVAEASKPLLPTSRPQPGIVEHPADDLWDSLAAACREAVSRFDGSTSDIVGVGLCTIRCCKAFLKEDGSLLQPVMSWMDVRAYEPWLPDAAELAWATTSSGYLMHRLTGEFRDTAANNVILQWPVDTDTWTWDPALFERFNLRSDLLFELQLPGEAAGTVTAEAAAETGLPEGIPVVQTANDKAVEALGSGSLDERTALVSLGTYIASMVHGHENRKTPQAFWTNFACIPYRYLYESHGIRRGMWTVSWFLDLLGPEPAEAAAAQGLSREGYLEREAEEVPPGSDGLMTVLDWLAPTDAPFRKGVMLGFDARHTRAHVYRSILEAIALTMKARVDEMCAELGTELDRIVVSGGGADSPLLMRIFADVFGIPAARNVGGSGASLGSAICVAVATGAYPDFEAAAAAMASHRERVEPDRANTLLYTRINDSVYKSLREATDPVLARSHPIFH
jgi:sugar (pentulose or hexulose) kinase